MMGKGGGQSIIGGVIPWQGVLSGIRKQAEQAFRASGSIPVFQGLAHTMMDCDLGLYAR